MEKKYENHISTVRTTDGVMARETHLLEAVAMPESYGLEMQTTPRRKKCSSSISPSVLTDFRKSSFDQTDLLLDVDKLDQSNNRNYQTDWEQKSAETIFWTSVGKPVNGMAIPNQQMNQMSGYGIASESSDVSGGVRTKTLKNRADTTHRSLNSDSNSSQFDTIDNEDVSALRNEEFLEKVSIEPVACSVCGDTVAGFHCGAYVCEACKKFFVRCLKQDAGMKFTCAHSQSCEITKETRTQCPSCRFQKCLKLGMYKPGGPNVSSEIGHIPCKVCGAPSSGFHFGAITCEGCKGFFRRTVKERDSLKYQCSRNSSCIITWKTRNVCKMCRYRQCLKAGMKPDKSRIGRQPNSVKHATMIELNQIKSAKGLAPLPFQIREFKSEPEDFVDSADNVHTAFLSDSNNGITLIATEFHEDMIHCDSAGLETKDSIMELVESATDAAQLLKSENLDEDRRSQLRYGAYLYDCRDGNQCRAPETKFPVNAPSPSPTKLYTGKNSQHTAVTKTHCYDFSWTPTIVGSDSLKPFTLPSREREVLCEKYMPTNISPVQVTCSNIPSSGPFTKPISPPDNPSSPLPDYDTVISVIQHSFKDLSVILSRSNTELVTASSSLLDIWDNMMTQFAHCAQATLRFAKKVPGFRKFAVSEQIHMIQSSMFPIVVVVLSLIYDELTERFCYFMYSHEEMCHILKKFEPFQLLVPAFHHMGLKVRQLDLDKTEVAFLCALHLMDSGNKHIYKELLLDSLEEYIKKKFGQICDRNGQILLCLRDMVNTDHIHQQAVNALLCPGSKYSNLEIPQLFKESFIAMDD